MQILLEAALDKALVIIKRWEGCRLKAYKCPAGIWTIGWGETKGVKEGDVWTQEKADSVLRERVREFMDKVIKYCPELLKGTDSMIAACTSLAYNIGTGAFASSSVCREIQKGNLRIAADKFMLWNKAGGKVLPGLVKRREDERKLFLQGI